MSISKFSFTDRARPIVQVGIGDYHKAAPGGVWDLDHWDQPGAVWAGVEPMWVDVTCNAYSYRCEYGRQRTTDRFIPGSATVELDNETGWADVSNEPLPNELVVRPGRAIRVGIEHVVYGTRWLFRGFIDATTPTYHPTNRDIVTLDCIDALGEVNRAKLLPLPEPWDRHSVDQRIWQILDRADWPAQKRWVDPTGEVVIGHDQGGQVADLLGQAAESGAGYIHGDYDGNIIYRGKDWQAYPPGTPVDGEISNVVETGSGNRVMFGTTNYLWFGDQVIEGSTGANNAACPTKWERPFARADIATRVLVGRDAATAVQLDDPEGQRRYGIEPFERIDLLTETDASVIRIAQRILNTRAASTAPRVRSVSLDAKTTDNALDLMATVDVYQPSRYRCRLVYPERTVFDEEYFATAVSHEVTPTSWTLELNLDSSAPYAVDGGRWDGANWDQARWAPTSVPANRKGAA